MGEERPQPAKVRTMPFGVRMEAGDLIDHKGGHFAIQKKRSQTNKGSAGDSGMGRFGEGYHPPSVL